MGGTNRSPEIVPQYWGFIPENFHFGMSAMDGGREGALVVWKLGWNPQVS